MGDLSAVTAGAVPAAGTVPDSALDAPDGGGLPRRVLMLLYHFPPRGGAATPRNVRNVLYLPRFGWTPVVVSPRDTGELADPDSLDLISPAVRVVRATSLEPRHLRPIVDLLRRVGRASGSAGTPEVDGAQRSGETASSADLAGLPSHAGTPAPSRFSRIRRMVFFPDNQVGWLPFAVIASMRLHRAAPFDAVYSTSAPITAHLIAGLVKRLTGAPWVAEFRDPWIGNPVDEAAGPLPWMHRRLRVRLERWIVRSADRIVFVSPSTQRLYRRRYPKAAAMVTITNGHDPTETIARVARDARSRPYRLVWAGALYRSEELRLFLEGLGALAARRPTLGQELEVVFYGHVTDSCRAVADRIVRDRRLGSIVRFEGFVPRRAALAALADADAALVMLGAGPGMGQFIPGKLFECLGLSQQVLAVLPPGDARDILEELDWGVIADPDPSEVERAIERLLVLPPPVRPADPDGRYDRVRLAGQLAATLRAAADDPAGPRSRQAGGGGAQ